MNNVQNIKKFLNLVSFSKELVIIALVFLVLGMMIIPLAPEVMDFIISLNLGLTVILLMGVVYLKSPLKLSSFPSILLILALLRIGITVSTSRLILLEANAGEIVQTFGEFVVGGNLIVGIIIFAIITIINFIVITKGSERVAEVAARFSLDAMPGKQMSIDSDLRANNITMEEAKYMRQELMLESKLYGAMDGAMKLVKGDAIASIIDILINLVGGVAVGMGQKGLDFVTACQTYSILTIGDGLVQQIPALMVSLTAGILITYVQNDLSPTPSSIAGNVVLQLFNDYRALIAAVVMLVIMALIPGMPSLALSVISIVVSLIAIYLYSKTPRKVVNPESIIEESVSDNEEINQSKFNQWQLIPLMLTLSANLKESPITTEVKKTLAKVKTEIFMDLGVDIPQVILRYNQNLDNDSYQILVNEIPASKTIIPPNCLLLLEHNQTILNSMQITSEQVIENSSECGLWSMGVWINNEYRDSCDEFKLQYLTTSQFMERQLKFVLSHYVEKFLGIQEVKNILDKMIDFQELIRELLRMLPLNSITDILQRLVHEGISIRDFKTILDTMLECAQQEKEPIMIVEEIRRALGRYIAYRFSHGRSVIPCFLLTQELEDMIRDAIRFSGKGSYLSLDKEVIQGLINNITSLYQEFNCSKLIVPVAIITHFDIRRYLRSVIEQQLSFIPVLSLQELENNVEYNVLNVIDVPNVNSWDENAE